MKTDITPRETVATFTLPLPLDAVPAIGELIKRIYGTGDIGLGMDGDSIRVIAPAEGFGAKKTGRGPAAVSVADDMKATYLKLRDGELKLTLSDKQNQVLVISEVIRQWFSDVGGVNYVEMTLADPESDIEWVYTVQHRDGETPHELRDKAEKRVAELEAELAELKGQN